MNYCDKQEETFKNLGLNIIYNIKKQKLEKLLDEI